MPNFTPGSGFNTTYGDLPDFSSIINEQEMRKRVTGIIPDQATFEAAQAAKIDDIIARLGLNREAFAGNLASRGLTLGGEVPRFLVRDIQAPALRAAATVITESNLKYAQISSAVSLDVYKTMLNAKLQEHLSKMNWLSAIDVANIQGQWAAEAAEARSKGQMWQAFGGLAVRVGFAIATSGASEGVRTAGEVVRS